MNKIHECNAYCREEEHIHVIPVWGIIGLTKQQVMDSANRFYSHFSYQVTVLNTERSLESMTVEEYAQQGYAIATDDGRKDIPRPKIFPESWLVWIKFNYE